MELSLRGTILCFILLAVVFLPDVHAKRPKFKPGPWRPARATFYGSPDGSGTYDGACGYGELQKQGKGYGVQTAAISTPLFEKGAGCGSCYELMCEDISKGCKPGAKPLTVTATNELPDADGWGQEHFDLTQPAFGQIGEYKAGVLTLQYRRVPCIRTGGIRFTISPNSNPYYLLVMVSNVGGAGDVRKMLVKGDKGKPFVEMTRDWGQNWVSRESLVGQSMTFRVITSDGKKVTSWHVAPKNWQFGQTFEGKNYK